jgi:hypothetical protein
MFVVKELDPGENHTSTWYNESEDGVVQDKNLGASAARFQAALAADMQTVEADDTQAEAASSMRSIQELKEAIGASLEAARAAAYSLHRGTQDVDSLGPIRQSLSQRRTRSRPTSKATASTWMIGCGRLRRRPCCTT